MGQPRNHNPYAQYVYIDIINGLVHFNAVPYNVKLEQALYPENIDPFYKNRILIGI